MAARNSRNGMEYILVLWPDSQELMEYPWFREECYLLLGHNDQNHYDCSYFVPKDRVTEVVRCKEEELASDPVEWLRKRIGNKTLKGLMDTKE